MSGSPADDLLRLADDCLARRNFREAERLCRDALQRQPDHPRALSLLSIAAWKAGNIQGAIDLGQRAVAAEPTNAVHHANLGGCMKDAGNIDAAIEQFRHAIALSPNDPTFHDALGTALTMARRGEEGLASYQRAVQLNPGYAEAWGNMAGALRILGRLQEAEAAVDKLLRFRPGDSKGLHNRALVLTAQERYAEAAESYRQSIAAMPGNRYPHWSLGTLHLLLGDFDAGWKEYQWRPQPPWQWQKPQWRGEDLQGKTIILCAEQGLGDTIQFVRYAPVLIERGARVWLAVQQELVELLSARWQVLRIGQRLPDYQFFCSLLDVPMVLATSASNIPAHVPYLVAPPDLQKTWAQRFGQKSARLRVGLAWAGSPMHKDDAWRSVTLEAMRPIWSVPDVEFISLQVGPAAAEAQRSSVRDVSHDLRDFRDTAALIANLDLVIAVDTSVVHLAGALAKPTWVLLPRVPDWRWLLERTDSPWYPTMRLFRQPARNQWQPVMESVAAALRQLKEL